MYLFLIIIHVLVSLALILVVLLQSGKGSGLAGAFGGGGGAMGAVFGGRGAATFLSKLTTILAIAFFISSLGHSLFVSRRFTTQRRSALREEAQRRTQQAQTPVPLVPTTPEQPTEGAEEGSVVPSELPQGDQDQ